MPDASSLFTDILSMMFSRLKRIAMTITANTTSHNLKQILHSNPPDQAKLLQQFFQSLETLPEDARCSAIKGFIEFADALPTDEYRAVFSSELHAWLNMVPDAAKLVGNSFQGMMDKGEGGSAWHRVVVSQSLSREISTEEQHRLHELFPESEPEPIAVRLQKAMASK